ncbi:MAG: hypothetical protein GY782_08635 [Gammaproteobacteria bacterium]|nr:hypothetical protein [Gammaproteobacteria bacterium]
MCKFFSCISDGKGDVLYFKPEEVVKIMAEGNPKEYDFNSHTSIAHFHGVNEDEHNKYEYSNKGLHMDQINTTDDRDKVGGSVKSFLEGKDLQYLWNLYNRNSGNRNSGYMNSGYMNSGYRNSGDMNSGDMNSGDMNSGNRNSGYRNSGYRNSGYMNGGDRNSGYMNSGYMNSGDMNSGDMNSGYRNSGDMNSGYRNSGYRNSGDMNSGYRNSGDMNSGDMNSGDGYLNSFCSDRKCFLFGKEATQKEYNRIYNIDFSWFLLNTWIFSQNMTKAEKESFPHFEITGGYLKTVSYKEAWSKCPKKVLIQIQKLPNFSWKIFTDITGITKEEK